MFDELFERTQKVNAASKKEIMSKLEKHVRKVLKQSYKGDMLEDAVEAITTSIYNNDPNILEDDEFGPAAGKEGWEEFVWDVAGRVGY